MYMPGDVRARFAFLGTPCLDEDHDPHVTRVATGCSGGRSDSVEQQANPAKQPAGEAHYDVGRSIVGWENRMRESSTG